MNSYLMAEAFFANLTTAQTIGLSMICLLFAGMFVFAGKMVGWIGACGVFAITAAIFVWIKIAALLLK